MSQLARPVSMTVAMRPRAVGQNPTFESHTALGAIDDTKPAFKYGLPAHGCVLEIWGDGGSGDSAQLEDFLTVARELLGSLDDAS